MSGLSDREDETFSMDEQIIDNKALEDAIEVFRADKENDSYVKVMELLEKSIVFVPIMHLGDFPPEAAEQIQAGKSVQIPQDAKVMPYLLQLETGEQVLPIFTSPAQIPPEKKSFALLAVPFMSCVAMTMANQDNVAKIALNPFSGVLILNQSVLDVAEKRRKAAEEIKPVPLTQAQFRDIVHNRLVLSRLPGYLFENGVKGLEELQQEKGALMMRFYREVYPKEKSSGFRAEDFSFMILNLTENIQLTRMDLPDKINKKGLCYRVYVALKRDTEELLYYALENTKAGEMIARVTKEGKHEIVAPVPDNGAEVEAVMNLIKSLSNQ